MTSPLFREAAVLHQRPGVSGETRLVSPVSFRVGSVMVLCLVVCVLAFAMTAGYTSRTNISGVLVPLAGVPRVIAQQAGTVAELRVQDGDRVHKGDPVLVIVNDRGSSDGSRTLDGVVKLLDRQRESLVGDIARERRQLVDRLEAISQRRTLLRAEITQLSAEVAGQRRRVGLAGDTVKTYERLVAENFAPELHLRQRREELLDHEGRLATLLRSKLAMSRELAELDDRADEVRRIAEAQIAQLERALSRADQENLEADARRTLVVLAPESGVVSALNATNAQNVNAGDLLFSILPDDTPLFAHLYAPSKAIGFVTRGQPVRLRFRSFAYQKFGQHVGRVHEVSSLAMDLRELPGQGASSVSEPHFRVVVELDEQEVRAFGKRVRLKPGTLVDATVMLERRSLAEWLFEPLISVGSGL